MNTEQELALPVIIISSFSILACAYVCASSYKAAGIKCTSTCCRKRKRKLIAKDSDGNDLSSILTTKTHTINSAQNTLHVNVIDFSNSSNLMIDIIFWMCVTDGLHSMIILINWLPAAIPALISPYSASICVTIGIVGEFLVIQSPCWHCLLAAHLLYLLIGTTPIKLIKNKIYHIIIVCILIPLIITLIPIIDHENIRNAYGRFDNLHKTDSECWVKAKSWQIVYIIFILSSLIFHYIVVITALYKWCNVYRGLRVRYWNIVVLCFRYIVVFSIIRFWPALERIIALLSTKDPSLWLIFAHHICISLLGLGDGIVWYFNQKTTRYTPRSPHVVEPNHFDYNRRPDNPVGDNKHEFQTPDQIHIETETESESLQLQTPKNKLVRHNNVWRMHRPR